MDHDRPLLSGSGLAEPTPGLAQFWVAALRSALQMSTLYVPHPVLTFADYLQIEEDSPMVKHEFLDGQARAMPGGSPDHARLIARVGAILGNALRGRTCAVFAPLRVRVLVTGLATYPDVSVICGQPVLDPEDPKGDTVTNPRVLVEILSPSTENYDRGEKLAHYQQVESLCEIVLVAHDAPVIDVYRRNRRRLTVGWSCDAVTVGQIVRLESIECDLPVDDVYRDPLAPPR